MNVINSIIGIVLLIILIIIGYKAGQLMMELNSPVVPKTNTATLTIPEQPSSTIIRWNHFPLTFYINDDFIRQKNPGYVTDVRKALDLWQSTGIVSFSLFENTSADITIEWVPTLKEKALDTLGNTNINFVNTSQFGLIQNAKIEMLTKSDSRQLNSNDMINLALHEIGHAIGLQHTTEEDIMNPVLIVPSNSVKEISTRDLGNLQEIYKTPAKPDLKISSINATKSTFTRLDRNYFYLNIFIAVQNVGLVDAENFSLQLSADNVVINEDVIQKIYPGNTLEIFQGNIKVDRNFTSIQVDLDPQNTIDELNEENNFAKLEVA